MLHIPTSMASLQKPVVTTSSAGTFSNFLSGIGSTISPFRSGRFHVPQITLPDPDTLSLPDESTDTQPAQMNSLAWKHGVLNTYSRAARHLSSFSNLPPRFRRRENILNNAFQGQATVIATSLRDIGRYRRLLAATAVKQLRRAPLPKRSDSGPAKYKPAKLTASHLQDIFSAQFFIAKREGDSTSLLYLTSSASLQHFQGEKFSYTGYLTINFPERKIRVDNAYAVGGRQSPEVDLVVGQFLDQLFGGAVQVFLEPDSRFESVRS